MSVGSGTAWLAEIEHSGSIHGDGSIGCISALSEDLQEAFSVRSIGRLPMYLEAGFIRKRLGRSYDTFGCE